MTFEKESLFPVTAEINQRGHLVLGGCDAVELAAQFGTPLYVFDEVTLRGMCREFVTEFQSRYLDTRVVYASKAFINPALARLMAEERLGLDVVSGGELAVAEAVEFPPDLVYFHGNNKTRDELEMALDYRIGRIVVDGFHELELLDGLAQKQGNQAGRDASAVAGSGPPHPQPHHHRRPGQQVRVSHRDRGRGQGPSTRPRRAQPQPYGVALPTWARPSSSWSLTPSQ